MYESVSKTIANYKLPYLNNRNQNILKEKKTNEVLVLH